jgi:hypothetical protein
MDTEIEILGPMAVRYAGTVQHLQSAQARVAFARLVLAGPEGVTRDELADVAGLLGEDIGVAAHRGGVHVHVGQLHAGALLQYRQDHVHP